jgi:uncharacterized membrane protein
MYLTLKFLHIIGVILFLGNITTGVFWKAHADRTRDPRLIAHVLDGIIRSDRYFTIPGVVIILVSGFAAALSAGIPLLRTAWTAGGIALFTIAGISFMARVAPLQQQMLKLARSSTDATTFDWVAYEKLSRSWAIWGAAALFAPVLAAGVMVYKPTW